MNLIINGKIICEYISKEEYNNNTLEIKCDDITDMGFTLASCYNNKATYIKHDDGHLDRIEINSVKINDSAYVKLGFECLGICTENHILIKVNCSNDIIREHITEDGHIDLFGNTFSIKRYNGCDEEIEYKLESITKEIKKE